MSKYFLGICILIMSLIIAGSIVFYGFHTRYEYVNGKIFDKLTGTIKTSNETTKINATNNSIWTTDDVNNYKKWVERAVEFEQDNKNGKIDGFNSQDISKIKEGLMPIGRYRNKLDIPDWCKGADGNQLYSWQQFSK